MAVLGNGGGFWWNWNSNSNNSSGGGGGGGGRSRRPRPRRSSLGSTNVEGGGEGFPFPLKPAATAASLAFTGDVVAQVWRRWEVAASLHEGAGLRRVKDVVMDDHDWIRSLRMLSYGFLLYGPGSHAWYRFLEASLPQPTLLNLSAKVLLNQIVLGPSVIAVVFAWNNLWQKKLSELPEKYRRDALPALLFGFRFWIPASILNFGVIPLQGRVAFMSTCSIFWNFYLSSTVSK